MPLRPKPTGFHAPCPQNRISILVALEGSDEGLRRAPRTAERSLGDLASSAMLTGEKASAEVAAFDDRVNKEKRFSNH